MNREAERVEAAFLAECLSDGLAMRRIGGGVVAGAPDDPGHFWTRAFGFGRQLTADELLAILDFYRGSGELQLAPWAFPPGRAEIRHANCPREVSSWVKLGCDIRAAEHRDDTDFSITEIQADHAGDWASVIAAGFGLGSHLRPVLAKSVGRPQARHFVAWDGTEAVGAACLYRYEDVGCLTTAATLPSHRNRGIQSALISRRAKEAAADGCRRLVAETGKPALAGRTRRSTT